MTALSLERIDGIAYRALPDQWDDDGPGHAVLCTAIRPRRTSGATYCQSWRAPVTAPSPPDLPGFGDSPADLPGTWEHQIEHLERFRRAVGIEQTALLVHDWGGLIGLRWACDHPGAVNALVIADTGFFPDGHWHGFAKSLKTEGEGEQIMDNMNRDLFALAMSQVSSGISDETIDEFYKAYSDPERKQSQLDLYRSGDFSKLNAYHGKLGELGAPTLLVWVLMTSSRRTRCLPVSEADPP